MVKIQVAAFRMAGYSISYGFVLGWGQAIAYNALRSLAKKLQVDIKPSAMPQNFY